MEYRSTITASLPILIASCLLLVHLVDPLLSVGKSNEVLMVGVHVGQLNVYQQQHLILGAVFSVPDVLGDDPLHLLSQHGVLSQL